MLSKGRFAGFRSHMKVEGTHAFLSPSTPHWLRYTEDKLIERMDTYEAAARGTRLHETAARCIADGIELRPDGKHAILAAYVNDAIELGMTPEQTLFYSMNCYGTADTIGFEQYIDGTSEYAGFLRIHDLKTGITKPHNDQLYVYAALFCLEYEFKPLEIQGELRFYQGSDVDGYEIDRMYLLNVYDSIVASNEIIEQRRMGGLF